MKLAFGTLVYIGVAIVYATNGIAYGQCYDHHILDIPGLLTTYKLMAQLPGQPKEFGPYAAIEMGGKGVKAFVIDYENARDQGCQKDQDRYLECLDLKQLKAINATPLDPKSIDDTVTAVIKQIELVQQYGVPPSHIFIVGSSGIANVSHRRQLEAAIINRVSNLVVNPIEFISAANESKYTSDGLFTMLPARYRSSRRRTAIIIDIGSGNTKGSYIEANGSSNTLVPISVPFGTKTATDAINANRGKIKFTTAAEIWRNKVLMPSISATLGVKPYLVNRKKRGNSYVRDRIYLLGGLPWSLVSLIPGNNMRNRFPVVTVNQITSLYKKATAKNAAVRLCSQNKANVPDSDVQRVCDTFTPDNLIAGLQILQGLAKELDFRNRKVFFFRDSQFAWPLGYLWSKIEEPVIQQQQLAQSSSVVCNFTDGIQQAACQLEQGEPQQASLTLESLISQGRMFSENPKVWILLAEAAVQDCNIGKADYFAGRAKNFITNDPSMTVPVENFISEIQKRMR